MNKKYVKMCVILFKIYSFVSEKATKQTLKLDMAKRAGRVGAGQSGRKSKRGHGSKRVIFKRVNRVAGQTGRGLNRVVSRVELTRIFQNFFFFEVDAICQLFMSSLTIIRFSLVILLPITTKHLT